MHKYAQAYRDHKSEAESAFALYRAHCNGQVPPRVPGMDTVIRLAWRIACGRSIEEAAAKEYVYRWNLAIKPSDQVLNTACLDPCVSIFGTPHTIGL